MNSNTIFYKGFNNLQLDVEGNIFAASILETEGDGLDGVENGNVFSLVLDIWRVAQLICQSTPEHGGQSQLHILPNVEIEHVRRDTLSIEPFASIHHH